MGCSSSNTSDNNKRDVKENDTANRTKKDKNSKKGQAGKISSKVNLNTKDVENVYEILESEEQYKKFISNPISIIMISSQYCSNCQEIEPVIYQYALSNKGIIGKINALTQHFGRENCGEDDENPKLPFIKMYKNNSITTSISGLKIEKIKEEIKMLGIKEPDNYKNFKDEEEDKFDEFKLQCSKSNLPLIVIGGQKYCPPCEYMFSRAMKAKVFKNNLQIIKVDVNSGLCRKDVIDNSKIDGIPIISYFKKNGELIGNTFGMKHVEFDKFLNEILEEDYFEIPYPRLDKVDCDNKGKMIPNRLEYTSEGNKQTFEHFPLCFNEHIFVCKDTGEAIYWYVDSERGYWRTTDFYSLDFSADYESDRLGMGSYYPKYSVSVSEIYEDSDYDGMKMEFFFDFLQGGKTVKQDEKLELSSEERKMYPSSIEIGCSTPECSDFAGTYFHHPISVNKDVYCHSAQENALYYYEDGGACYWRLTNWKGIAECSDPNNPNLGAGHYYAKYGALIDDKYKDSDDGEWKFKSIF